MSGKRSNRRPSVPANVKTGRAGEKTAERYLLENGYRIYGRNVRFCHDEIDIIAWDPVDNVVVFAEVKTRTIHSDDFCPSLNLTHRKRYAMCRAARKWVVEHRWYGGYRLDLLSVAKNIVVQHNKELAWSRSRM